MEKGAPIPVVITIYADRSFTFEMKTPPMSHFLKKAAKIESGSKTPGRDSAGSVTKAQVKEIAEAKMKDLNATTIEAAMKKPITTPELLEIRDRTVAQARAQLRVSQRAK